MSKFKKIQEYGIKGSVEILALKFSNQINKFFIWLFHICPMKEEVIMLESEPDLSDNTYALFHYMQENELLKKYKVIWLVDYPEVFTKEKNIVYCKKNAKLPSLKKSFYQSVCSIYIYDHCNAFAKVNKRRCQKVISLTHGLGFKARKAQGNYEQVNKPDEVYITGEIGIDYIEYFLDFKNRENIKTLGYPRTDYFFCNKSNELKELTKKYKFHFFSKIIVWMPTFRKSTVKALSEDYNIGSNGLPLLDTADKLVQFNAFLKKLNIMCILKVHHLQSDMKVFHCEFSNILILKDEILANYHVQLYELVGITDALITDYSSIAYDYLLLDRPIIFIVDDYEDYEKSRGFYIENVLEYMPGYHIYTVNELEDSISEISVGKDKYREQRHVLCPQYHSYNDGKASERILGHLGITM